jgi:DNA repair exonuclease SbcCD nuclease subunit
MIQKLLIVGDPHVTPDDLEDAEKLFEYVGDVAANEKVDQVVLLGDLHHTFTLTNIKVTGFYKNVFQTSTESYLALVGNHDMPGDGSGYPHALMAYEKDIKVVDKPHLDGGILYLPYYPEAQSFIGVCREYADRSHTVICHQDLNGAIYDNGFYAPHGANPGDVSQFILSGHIHTQQRFANVWYPGAPRWRTISDADAERAIWVVTFDNGVVTNTKPYSMTGICRQIRTATITESTNLDVVVGDIRKTDDWRITVQGSADFVAAKTIELSKRYPSAKLKQIIQEHHVKVRESEGIDVAWKKYLKGNSVPNNTPVDVLEKLAQERLYGEAKHR